MFCFARGYCKKYDTEVCDNYCDLKIKLDVLYSESNLPERYKEQISLYPREDIEAFRRLAEIQKEVLSFVNSGSSLLITSSTTGNGKTTWATKIANQYIRKVVAKSDLENEVLYLNTSLFMEKMRFAYSKEDEELDRLMEKAFDCKLLILDDIGAERPSDWVLERLYDLINHRYCNLKSTIYTSNLSHSELAERLGSRIGSRLREAEEVTFKSSDARGRV